MALSDMVKNPVFSCFLPALPGKTSHHLHPAGGGWAIAAKTTVKHQGNFKNLKKPGSIQYIYLFDIVTGNEMHYG